jgi:UDP-sugar transporter A1/2/3
MKQQPTMSPSRLRFLRFVTLVCLLFTDGTYSILRRYSRGVLREIYSVNEVLLLGEVIKLLFSCYMMTTVTNGGGDDNSIDPTLPMKGLRLAHLTRLIVNSKKMLVLAFLYGVGNVLSYFALARVGAGTFVVVANLKTLTTAVFSTLMLGNRYSWTQWRALILLVAGVVLFVLPTLKKGGNAEDDIVSSLSKNDLVLGVAAEMVVITLSGYASIYFERAIKHDPFDIWERNFQLCFYGILMYITLISLETQNVHFSNWTPMAFALSFLGAAGGLLVALSIKYGDSVLKTLAISGSIIYASIVDHVCLDGPMNEQMGLSAIVVVIAVLNYNFDATAADPPAKTIMNGDATPADRYEKATEDCDSEMQSMTDS